MSSAKCSSGTSDKDLSAIDYPSDFKTFATWEISLKIVIVISIELVAVLGNVLVIVIIVQSKKMRTVTNYYIVNLAISDLSVACFSIWMHVVDDLTQGWVMGSFLCKFNPFLQITAMCASVFTLVAIAGDRFFAIMLPLRSRVTQRKVSVMIIIIWMAAIAIGMPVLFFYTYGERQWRNFFEGYCVEVWPSVRNKDGQCDAGLKSRSTYWICVLVVLNWVPMLLMMVAYTVILRRLHRGKKVAKSARLSISVIQQRSKRRVVTMLFTILMGFIICAVPFQVAKLYELFSDLEDSSAVLPEWYNPVYFAAVTLLYTNSALNPILYGGLNDNFRTGFKSIINKIFRRKTMFTTASNANNMSRRSVVQGIQTDRRESQITILDDANKNYVRANTENNVNERTMEFINEAYEQ
ncbi:hypothetical protein FSP39_023889 [Pinctada imbricata]|uniref:G-protein coupled receptors family 1 profile domain-containing protein n=1 Tax=Pinctada imbricata TaxID=66713 RepID=A0AA89BV17_PINIB|nr:hypothetical protein FSP39_023889 [Pinctada imbricata]